jgi:hypothetical protein
LLVGIPLAGGYLWLVCSHQIDASKLARTIVYAENRAGEPHPLEHAELEPASSRLYRRNHRLAALFRCAREDSNPHGTFSPQGPQPDTTSVDESSGVESSSLRGLLDALDGFGEVDVLRVFSTQAGRSSIAEHLPKPRSEASRESKPTPASPMHSRPMGRGIRLERSGLPSTTRGDSL